MNCIWVLLLLCCCGHGNNSSGNVRGNENHNHCAQNHDCGGDSVREQVDECRDERRDERREERREEWDRNSGERRSEREERECSCENNFVRTERVVPPIRNDFGAYGRNDRFEDNDYNRRSGDFDRRERRCETCGCEAE